MAERRRVPRLAATWSGACLIDGDPSYAWQDCDIFDISALGVGIALRTSRRPDLIGRRISIRVPAPLGASLDLTLRGYVKNATAGQDGTMRIGVEFVDLSESELYLVDLLHGELSLVDLLQSDPLSATTS